MDGDAEAGCVEGAMTVPLTGQNASPVMASSMNGLPGTELFEEVPGGGGGQHVQGGGVVQRAVRGVRGQPQVVHLGEVGDLLPAR